MTLQSIPEAWLRDVIATLRRDDPSEIYPTRDFTTRLQSSFPGVFQYEVVEAFRSFLSSGCPRGCPVNMDHPEGESWEFYFPFQGIQTYGKILIRTDRKRIVLFSAHLPTKHKLSCE